VLTDLPRLLFLDPVGNIVRGNLELSSAVAKIDIKMVGTAIFIRLSFPELLTGSYPFTDFILTQSTVVDFEVLISGVTNRFTSTEIPEKNAVVSHFGAARVFFDCTFTLSSSPFLWQFWTTKIKQALGRK